MPWYTNPHRVPRTMAFRIVQCSLFGYRPKEHTLPTADKYLVHIASETASDYS